MSALPPAPGPGFKAEHFAAIRNGRRTWASGRFMPRTTWARAGCRTPSFPRSGATTASRWMAWACPSADPVPWTATTSPDCTISATATSPRASPSISPGRAMTAPISTTCCRCPTRQRRRGSSATSRSSKPWPPLSAGASPGVSGPPGPGRCGPGFPRRLPVRPGLAPPPLRGAGRACARPDLPRH